MNNVYFACTQCKVYLEAGYRWAYSHLEEPGIVRQGEVVRTDNLLLADSYWKPEPEEQSEWLNSTLPHVKELIDAHQHHSLIYGEMEHLIGVEFDDYERFAWMDLDPSDMGLEPRNFIEQLGLRSWGEVIAYIDSLPYKPWWYGDPDVDVIARRKFEELLALRPVK